MNGLRLLACLAVIVSAASARAQTTNIPRGDYTGAQRRYTDRDVLALFGKTQAQRAPPELLFDVGVRAGLHTKVSCGRLGVGLNLDSIARRVAELPTQIANQSQALLGALPMLTVCYASPALCAELKNLNFQIDQRLKGLTDVCRGIDQYIDSQSASEMGQQAAFKRGWEHCVREQKRAGATEDQAQESCNRADPQPLYTDIARAWLTDATTRGEQNVIAALLEASGQRVAGAVGERNYRFLSSVLGELKLDVNGKLLPVFPAHPTTATSLRIRIQRMGTDLACNTARLGTVARGRNLGGGVMGPLQSSATPPDVQYYEQALFDVTQEELTPEDAEDVEVLDPPDRALACNALGRSLGRAALQRCADSGEAIMNVALQNPALPEHVRQIYEGRATRTFKVLLREAEAPPERSLRNIRGIIHTMADRVRETRRNTAAEISKGLQDWDAEFRQTVCESEETCEP